MTTAILVASFSAYSVRVRRSLGESIVLISLHQLADKRF